MMMMMMMMMISYDDDDDYDDDEDEDEDDGYGVVMKVILKTQNNKWFTLLPWSFLMPWPHQPMSPAQVVLIYHIKVKGSINGGTI